MEVVNEATGRRCGGWVADNVVPLFVRQLADNDFGNATVGAHQSDPRDSPVLRRKMIVNSLPVGHRRSKPWTRKGVFDYPRLFHIRPSAARTCVKQVLEACRGYCQ